MQPCQLVHSSANFVSSESEAAAGNFSAASSLVGVRHEQNISRKRSTTKSCFGAHNKLHIFSPAYS
eukprot:m.455620 g.455620  ORF g.455620 m.455620 type:complete len:66 (-) comp21573_c0_seq17:217-414(-)